MFIFFGLDPKEKFKATQVIYGLSYANWFAQLLKWMAKNKLHKQRILAFALTGRNGMVLITQDAALG